MPKFLAVLMSFCVISMMQSCSSDLDPIDQIDLNNDAIVTHMFVKFDGRIFETDVIEQGDSVLYLDNEYAKVYRDKISGIKNGAALLYTDQDGVNYVEYFASEKDLLDNYIFFELGEKSDTPTPPTSRSRIIDLRLDYKSEIIAFAELYDDKNFRDTELITYASTSWCNRVDRLSRFGFNDKTSSIKVFNTMNPSSYYTIQYNTVMGTQWATHRGDGLRPVLKCYHNSDYSGSTIYCVSSPTGSAVNHTDNNLKTIGWNDKISSIEWIIVFDFSVFNSVNGADPEIQEHPDC